MKKAYRISASVVMASVFCMGFVFATMVIHSFLEPSSESYVVDIGERLNGAAMALIWIAVYRFINLVILAGGEEQEVEVK